MLVLCTWYDLQLDDCPGGAAHHAGVVAGVSVPRTRDVEPRLRPVHQQVRPHAAGRRGYG